MMKKRNTILAFFLTCLLLTIGCCKDEKCKDEPEPETKDYRDEWMGAYSCRYVASDPRFSYSCRIDVSSIGDSLAFIKETKYPSGSGSSLHDTIKVNRDGSFTFFHFFLEPADRGYFYNKDNIAIHINGGLHYGTKIKND